MQSSLSYNQFEIKDDINHKLSLFSIFKELFLYNKVFYITLLINISIFLLPLIFKLPILNIFKLLILNIFKFEVDFSKFQDFFMITFINFLIGFYILYFSFKSILNNIFENIIGDSADKSYFFKNFNKNNNKYNIIYAYIYIYISGLIIISIIIGFIKNFLLIESYIFLTSLLLFYLISVIYVFLFEEDLEDDFSNQYANIELAHICHLYNINATDTRVKNYFLFEKFFKLFIYLIIFIYSFKFFTDNLILLKIIYGILYYFFLNSTLLIDISDLLHVNFNYMKYLSYIRNTNDNIDNIDYIEFNNLQLGYKAKKVAALNYLRITKETPIKITGASGSGKTTLIKSFLQHIGYYGDIYVYDGYKKYNIKNINLMNKIFYVTQTPDITNDTFKDYFKNELKDKSLFDINKLLEILELMDLTSLFNKLPKGLDENLNGGNKFSYGQKARLDISRKIYGALNTKDSILIFDESFDNISHDLITKILIFLKEKLNNQAFIIVISHNPNVFDNQLPHMHLHIENNKYFIKNIIK